MDQVRLDPGSYNFLCRNHAAIAESLAVGHRLARICTRHGTAHNALDPVCTYDDIGTRRCAVSEVNRGGHS